MSSPKTLQPKLSLSDLSDSNVVYSSRPSYLANPWLEAEEHQSNFLTARELIIANQLPVIVHKASVTDKIQQLFEMIGKDMPENIYSFEDRQTYERLLKDIAHTQNKKIYFSNLFKR